LWKRFAGTFKPLDLTEACFIQHGHQHLEQSLCCYLLVGFMLLHHLQTLLLMQFDGLSQSAEHGDFGGLRAVVRLDL
jgi:hypothetical protein